jgi:hypothetical protein
MTAHMIPVLWPWVALFVLAATSLLEAHAHS